MPKRERVIVALSGGVDSAVAAALLVEQGHEVIGLMLHLWSEAGQGSGNRCCTPEAVEDARQIARSLGVPFRLLNAARRFKDRVVDPFIREYALGRTPNPCLFCNRHIKFGYLLRMALSLDADYLATGHYARVRRADGAQQLLRGIDTRKDQSYFLYMLGQEQLRRVRFPVGSYTKAQVREMAAGWGLAVAGKEDSQDICFVRDQDYRRFMRTFAPDAVQPGPILFRTGQEVGVHQGLPFYTIGQRRGLGISWPEPLYVLEIDAARNALVVGPGSELGRQDLEVTDVSFVAAHPTPVPVSVTCKIRYTGTEVGATLYPGGKQTVKLHLATTLRDVTPGQAAVFYQGEVVLGGGTIAKGTTEGTQ